MKRKLFPTLAAAAVAMAAGAAMSGSAQAQTPTPVVDINGDVTGFDGISFNGALYDVSFISGTCLDAFTSCSGNAASFLFLGQPANALGASRALANEVSFLDLYNNVGPLVGCSNVALDCNILTPFSGSGSNVSAFDLRIGNGGSYPTNVIPLTVSSSSSIDGQDYAVWSVEAVPEPASAAVLALGAAALAGVRTKRRKKNGQ